MSGQITFPTREVGDIVPVSIVNPAAGAQFLLTAGAGPLTAGFLWRPLTFSFNFACDANPATRYIIVYIDDGVTIVQSIPDQNGLTAGLANRFCYGLCCPYAGITGGAANGPHLMPLPDIIIQDGYRIQSAISSIQVGDQISDIRMTFQWWRAM